MDSGKVQIVYRHFIVVGPESALAAEGAECAGDQGQFFPYHDLLFENQGPENAGYITQERLTGFAEQLELDTEQFAQCLDSEKYHQKVGEMVQEGQAIDVHSTPTVYVNGRLISNPLDVSQMRSVILDELDQGS